MPPVNPIAMLINNFGASGAVGEYDGIWQLTPIWAGMD
jgi:hypothetical protein